MKSLAHRPASIAARLTTSLSLASLLLSASSAGAAEFTAHHMFVANFGSGKITEFDDSGQFQRNLSAPGLQQPMSMTFGPDGQLYVAAFNHKIFRFAADGSSSSFAVGTGASWPTGVAFGPRGDLYVSGFNDLMYRVDVSQNPPQTVDQMDIGYEMRGLAFGANGHAYVALPGDNKVLEVDVSGETIQEISSFPMKHPVEPMIGEHGQLWVACAGDDNVLRYTAYGAPIGGFSPTGVSLLDGAAFGPDGSMYLASRNSNRVVRVDGDNEQVLGEIGAGVLELPSAIAFAPVRFEAKLKGKITKLGSETIKTSEKAILSVDLGRRSVSLAIEPGLFGDNIAATFVQPSMVFHGFVTRPVEPKKTTFGGYEIHPIAAAAGLGSIALTLKSSSAGPVEMSKVTGTIQRDGASGTFQGTLKAKERIN